jgi:hypothetical protein
MALDPAELDELADFFARRFDHQLQPADPARPVPTASWRERLEEAQASGRLSVLVHRARSRRPDDANLAAVARLIAEPNRRGDQAIGLLLLGAGVAAAALALATVGGLAGVAAVHHAGVAREPVAATLRPAVPVLDAGRLASVERTVSTWEAGRCGGEPGEVVGYWYAGTTAPPGDTVVLDRMVNVRAAYPAASNGWDSRSRITCVLRPGDRVRLDRAPVHVDGDRYWIPLVAGGLVAASS